MSAATRTRPRDPRGYYRLLGLPPDAGEAEIRRAWRRAAKRWHPDRNPSPEAQRRMAELNEAYRTLADPDRRAAYDRGDRDGNGGLAGPPRPVVWPDRLVFGPLAPGGIQRLSVALANAGGPCATGRIEPSHGPWHAFTGAKAAAARGLVQLEFEARFPPGLSVAPGAHEAVVSILLDEEETRLTLVLQVEARRSCGPGPAARTGGGGAGRRVFPLAGPPAGVRTAPTGAAARYAERHPLWKRIALAAAAGLLARPARSPAAESIWLRQVTLVALARHLLLAPAVVGTARSSVGLSLHPLSN